MNMLEKDNHLANFDKEGSILASQQAYNDYMRQQDYIGRSSDNNDPRGSMFVAPKEEIDRVLKDSNGDISKVEKALGLPEGHFGNDPIVRVDIQNIHNQGLRVANGYESGANEFWNTKVDSNGNLPNISYVKDAEGNNTRYIDTSKTDPTELSKLNGQYWDEKGHYHKPNSDGYDGKTSTGINEAVVNRVQNNAENVTYTELSGFKRGNSSDVSATRINDGYGRDSVSEKDKIEKIGVPHSNAPPSDENKSDLRDMNSTDKFGRVSDEHVSRRSNSAEESFKFITQADIANKEGKKSESFQSFSEDDLAKRGQMQANKGSELPLQSLSQQGGINGAENKKANSSGMGV